MTAAFEMPYVFPQQLALSPNVRGNASTTKQCLRLGLASKWLIVSTTKYSIAVTVDIIGTPRTFVTAVVNLCALVDGGLDGFIVFLK